MKLSVLTSNLHFYLTKTDKFYYFTFYVRFSSSADPLPDTGQWFLLALNEKLPKALVNLLRAHIITLHHYLVIFVMLAFSVTFGSIKPPGLGFAARYIFTMAVGRLLRAFTFIATILPSPRPWCALVRYRVPHYPHPWAQKYYEPYASDPDTISRLLQLDSAYGLSILFPFHLCSHKVVQQNEN
jgi:hypothetical protein